MAIRNFASDDGGSTRKITSPIGSNFIKSLPGQGTTSYSQLVNSPVPSAGTPLYKAQPYVAPYRAPAPVQQAQQVTGGYGATGAGNGAGNEGISSGIASTPQAPRTYDSFTDQEAATDSVFMDQKSQYANALKKFIEDNERQKGILDTDAKTAQEGIGRNRTNGLTGLSEDFAARGLSNSGMFTEELGKADKQYDNQKQQVAFGLKNAQDDLGFRRAKFEGENGENGSNIQAARREAFARLAASQGLT